MSGEQRIACGLDVGTSKTCIVMAQVLPDGKLKLIGSGFSSSQGLTNGVIVNSESAADSIRQAAVELESRLDFPIEWVTTGISGEHVRSYNLHSATSIENEIRQQIVRSSSSRAIIHILPQALVATGSEPNVHVIDSDQALLRSLINAVNRAHIQVRNVRFTPLASGEAVLTPDEKEKGIALIDIGAGTTGLCIFSDNTVSCISIIPMGGDHFTNDLVKRIRAPKSLAEQIKKEYGSLQPEEMSWADIIAFQGLGNRMQRIPRKTVCEIIGARAVQLLWLVRNQLQQLHRPVLGAVFTGGGSTLEGILELAEDILGLPVRLGLPQGVDGAMAELAHPIYAGAVGLVMLDAQSIARKAARRLKLTSKSSLTDKILSWLEDRT